MSGTRSQALKEQATEVRVPEAALVLAAHGIRGSVGTAAGHAGLIRQRGFFAEVHACAHKGAPDLVATLEALTCEDCFLVPLLMAEGFTLKAMLKRIGRASIRSQIRICRPVGVHPRLSRLIGSKALATCELLNWRTKDTALMIVGHGTRRDPNSGTTARAHASVIAAGGGFAEVVVAFLDEQPVVTAALAATRAAHCVAVGMFVDRGEHGEEDIPDLLAGAGARAAYAGPIGTDPMMVELILDQVREAASLAVAA